MQLNVTPEIGLLLKEIGYIGRTNYIYCNKFTYSDVLIKPRLFITENVTETLSIRQMELMCYAPLWSEVMEWFNAIYQYSYFPQVCADKKYYFTVYKESTNNLDVVYESNVYDTILDIHINAVKTIIGFISPTKAVADRYMDEFECIKRLIKDYKTHNSLLVAFDFDSTVFDYLGYGDTFPFMESILKRAKKLGCKLILLTSNEGERLQEIIKYCDEHGYKPDYVNESPVMNTRKPYYNILLDDRAGLKGAYDILSKTFNNIEKTDNLAI